MALSTRSTSFAKQIWQDADAPWRLLAMPEMQGCQGHSVGQNSENPSVVVNMQSSD